MSTNSVVRLSVLLTVVAAFIVGAPIAVASNAQLSATADFDLDGYVDASDLAQLLAAYGQNLSTREDINRDGVVDSSDLAALLSSWSETAEISLRHITGDQTRRNVEVIDVIDVETSPFYPGWSRLWIISELTHLPAAIDVPVSLTTTRKVLSERGWIPPSIFE